MRDRTTNKLLDAYCAIDDLLISHNYRNPSELNAAVSAIGWMYGVRTFGDRLSFLDCCDVHSADPYEVRSSVFEQRENRWTENTVAPLVTVLGVRIMSEVVGRDFTRLHDRTYHTQETTEDSETIAE